jgi:hypothetical protein
MMILKIKFYIVLVYKSLSILIDLDTLLGTGRSDTDLNTSITIFSKFTSEELVQFGVEDTIGDLLSK